MTKALHSFVFGQCEALSLTQKPLFKMSTSGSFSGRHFYSVFSICNGAFPGDLPFHWAAGDRCGQWSSACPPISHGLMPGVCTPAKTICHPPQMEGSLVLHQACSRSQPRNKVTRWDPFKELRLGLAALTGHCHHSTLWRELKALTAADQSHFHLGFNHRDCCIWIWFCYSSNSQSLSITRKRAIHLTTNFYSLGSNSATF